MFGYVQANRKDLSEEQKKCYKGFYCGLCRTLKARYGAAGMLSLSYDMTFLAMLLADLYDEETKSEFTRCMIHPMSRHEAIITKADEYAADMELILTYYSLLDHASDHDANRHELYRRKLEGYLPAFEKKYPRQIMAIKEGLAELEREERKKTMDSEKLSLIFGSLLGEVFVREEDNWKEHLFAIGSGLGRFVYLADAYTDLQSDTKKGKFNPFAECSKAPDFDDKVKDMLSWAASDAAKAFEYLPLDEYQEVLRNILYSGIWTQIQTRKAK
jgi:hypothetical protein